MNWHLTTDIDCENPASFLNSMRMEENRYWNVFAGTSDKTLLF